MVEEVSKQLLRGIRELSTDLNFQEAQWPSLARSIQYIINNFPSRRLKHKSPLKVNTGEDSGNPLAIDLLPTGITDVSDLDQCSILQNVPIEPLQESLDNFHRDFNSTLTDERAAEIKCHNENTHVNP